MTLKQNNRLLLFTILGNLVLASILPFITGGIKTGIDVNSLIGYAIFTITGLLILKKNKTPILEWLPYNVPMKGITVLLIVALFIAIIPIMAIMSIIGGIIFPDTYSAIIGTGIMSKASFPESLFSYAVVPAIFEELFYRGFFYQGFKKGRGARTAIILSGILFGTFHMVPQQALYAAVAGILFAIVRELTGSLWPGMLLHLLNNGSAVVESFAVEANPNSAKFFLDNYTNFDSTKNTIIFIILLLVSIPAIYLILKTLAKVENREEDFATFFKKTETDSPAAFPENAVASPENVTASPVNDAASPENVTASSENAAAEVTNEDSAKPAKKAAKASYKEKLVTFAFILTLIIEAVVMYISPMLADFYAKSQQK